MHRSRPADAQRTALSCVAVVVIAACAPQTAALQSTRHATDPRFEPTERAPFIPAPDKVASPAPRALAEQGDEALAARTALEFGNALLGRDAVTLHRLFAARVHELGSGNVLARGDAVDMCVRTSDARSTHERAQGGRLLSAESLRLTPSTHLHGRDNLPQGVRGGDFAVSVQTMQRSDTRTVACLSRFYVRMGAHAEVIAMRR